MKPLPHQVISHCYILGGQLRFSHTPLIVLREQRKV